MSKAISLTKAQIKRTLRVCKLMPHSEVKRCALVLSHVAMRVTEVARLKTDDVLYSSGEIKKEVHLPSSICKGLKSRTIWLTNKLTREILQEWIEFRLKNRWGCTFDDSQYIGLDPGTKFLLNSWGKPYALTNKRKKLKSGEIKTYMACDALEHIAPYIKKWGYIRLVAIVVESPWSQMLLLTKVEP